MFQGARLEVDLLTATVSDLVQLLNAGKVTSEQLVQGYVARIAKNNLKGLKLRAVLELAPLDSLIQQARQYDLERQQGNPRGPLHGVPILVKDNIATAASLGMNTTAGSYALRKYLLIFGRLTVVGSVVPRDATVVAKLRKAGAIILGKSNLSEWSNFRGVGLRNGWSARGGQTQSAYVVGG